jgi:hypothetical protein
LQSSENNAPQMTIGEQCKAFRDIMMKQKEEAARKITRNVGTGEQLFIVVLLSNLKRMGESALRWSFFTLNAFIMTLYLCSTTTSNSYHSLSA